MRIAGFKRQIGGADIFVFIQNLLKRLTAIGGTKDAALLVWSVGMTFHCDEQAIRILGIDENCGDLLCVAKAEMLPGVSRVGGFIKTVAGGQIRTLQALTAAYVENIGIGRGDGDRSDRAGALIVEDGLPGVAKIRCLPHAAINRGHIENIGLVWNAGDGHGAAAAKRTNATPAHFGEELLVILLGGQRDAGKENHDQSLEYFCEPLSRCVSRHFRPSWKSRRIALGRVASNFSRASRRFADY